MVSAHLAAGRLVVGRRTAATIGRGTREQPLVPGAIVVSAAVVTPPRHKQNPATRGHGGTADWDRLPGVYGADAPRPAGKRRPSGPAAAGAMDRDGPGELVLVWPTAV